MSVTDGQISNRMGIVISPDGTSGDLQKVFNRSNTNKAWFFVYADINMWSSHKPFRNTTIFTDHYDNANSARWAALVAANFSLSIPRHNATDFKSHYSDTWSLLRARGPAYNEPQRAWDFEQYRHNCPWLLGPTTFGGVQDGYYTIFNGYLSVPRTQYIYPGDLLTFSLQCAEDPETGVPGILYPYSFYREQLADLDLSRYYMGIALLDAQNKLWIITGDQMRSHHTQDDVEAYMTANVPNSIVTGAVKIIPVLAETAYPSWDDAPGSGHFISLNGAFLSRQIGSATSKLTVDVDATFSNGTLTMVWKITNNTSSDVNLSNLYSYIMSAESYYNEGDSDHNPPTTGGYGVTDYIDEHWPGAAPYTPPSDHMGLSNPPDIYLSDWISGIGSPAYLAARGYNARTDFRAANNNSDTIRVGATVTWTKTMNIGNDDGCGYYADGVFVAACMYVNMNAYTEYFAD